MNEIEDAVLRRDRAPVMNVDHATGLCGGIDDPSGVNDARLREARKVRQAAAARSGRA